MKLLTEHLKHTIPPLYATENEDDPTVHLKLFHPAAHATWLVTEASVQRDGEYLPLEDYEEGDEVIFFSYAELLPGYGELGYTALSELRAVRVMGLPIERDRHFQPCPLSIAREQAGI